MGLKAVILNRLVKGLIESHSQSVKHQHWNQCYVLHEVRWGLSMEQVESHPDQT